MSQNKDTKKNFIFWLALTVIGAMFIAFWYINLSNIIKGYASKPSEIDAANQEWKKMQEFFGQFQDIDQVFAMTKDSIDQAEQEAKKNEFKNSLISAAENKKDKSLPVDSTIPKKTTTPVNLEINPAAIYCLEKNGTIDQRQNPAGENYNVCIFNDNSECGEKEFFTKKCKIGEYKKWEDEIIKKPDLIVEVKKNGYCNAMSQPIQWEDGKKAKYFCFEGVSVKNIGWIESIESEFLVAGKFFKVPQLKPGKSYIFDKSFFVKILEQDMVATLKADAKNVIKEINEENNIYNFPNEK